MTAEIGLARRGVLSLEISSEETGSIDESVYAVDSIRGYRVVAEDGLDLEIFRISIGQAQSFMEGDMWSYMVCVFGDRGDQTLILALNVIVISLNQFGIC
jgi:hypothetical protein